MGMDQLLPWFVLRGLLMTGLATKASCGGGVVAELFPGFDGT
jgi:hypothetical protein